MNPKTPQGTKLIAVAGGIWPRAENMSGKLEKGLEQDCGRKEGMLASDNLEVC
jgi:hypothetical protein